MQPYKRPVTSSEPRLRSVFIESNRDTVTGLDEEEEQMSMQSMHLAFEDYGGDVTVNEGGVETEDESDTERVTVL